MCGRRAPHTPESHYVIYGQASGLTESKVQNMQRRRGSSLNVNTGELLENPPELSVAKKAFSV